MFDKIMRKIIRRLDPKFDKYRTKPPKVVPPPYTPKSLQDFISILQRTPRSILSDKDRNRIAAVMSFDDRIVQDLMIPRSKMIFVKNSEVLGPLTLDKLYKSGFTDFPVVDSHDKILGVIHTDALNALEIKKTDRASKYLDRTVNYLRASDSLEHAIECIEHLGGYYFLVTDDHDNLIGFFTIQLLLDYLLS